MALPSLPPHNRNIYWSEDWWSLWGTVCEFPSLFQVSYLTSFLHQWPYVEVITPSFVQKLYINLFLSICQSFLPEMTMPGKHTLLHLGQMGRNEANLTRASNVQFSRLLFFTDLFAWRCYILRSNPQEVAVSKLSFSCFIPKGIIEFWTLFGV